MLQGHLNYYAVSGNHPSIWWFCNPVRGGLGSRRFGVGARRQIGSPSSIGIFLSFVFTVSTPKPEGGARCVSSARRDLGGGEE
jgi:hypothetical protein